MKRGKTKRAQLFGWVLALAPTLSLAQQNPGLSAQPAGRLLGSTNPPAIPSAVSEAKSVDHKSAVGTEESVYAEAAASGNAWAQAKLAEVYLRSVGDAVKLSAGLELLRQAAAKNEPFALYQLGALSMEGRGLPQSTIQGFQYCKRAAELGYPPAFYQLAALYATGRGTAIDEEQAIYWGRKAIEQGNSKSKYSIGRLLLLRGKPEETNEAVLLLDQASVEGVAEAAVLLAGAYAEGIHGVNKDQAKARLLLKRHAESNTEAHEALANLPVSE